MLTSFVHAWRSWKTARGAGLLTIAALAVGIGSATAIFSIVQAVLLNPLPWANPDRYYFVFGAWHTHPDWWTSTSYADYVDLAAQLQSVDTFGCSTSGSGNITFHNQPQHVSDTEVSSSLVRSFGIKPILGRWFSDKGEPNGLRGAVLSYALWRRLGSDPNIIGQPMTVNGALHTITGVVPAWFRYPIYGEGSELWIPLNPTKNQQSFRSYHYLKCIAKMKAGVTTSQLKQDGDRVLAGLRRQYPDQAEPEFTNVKSVIAFATEQIRPSLILLLIAAGVLFCIAAANVASVLLARSVARARDTAVRVALGAGLWQLGNQYFLEGLLVSLAGTAAGSLLSYILVRVVLSLAADEIPRAESIAFNWQVLGFALCLAVGCALFCSLAPLWQARRIAPNEVLSEGVRASASARSRKLLRIFVIAEVALAVALLSVGGVIVEHLGHLYQVSSGLDPNDLLITHLYAPEQKYKSDADKQAYQTRLLRAIRSLPVVENAGFTDLLPLEGWGNNTVIRREDQPAPKDWLQTESIEMRFVSPSYFETMHIPLMAGRLLTDADKEGPVMPLIINETLAKLEWPHENPVGSYVRIFAWNDKRFQVVGVVGDTRNTGLYRPPRPEFDLSYRMVSPSDMTWAVRSSLPISVLTAEIRRAVRSVDPDQPIFDTHPMHEIVTNSLARQRLQSLMTGFFAASALLLAILGVYGVVSYTVRQRISEMGTRMALGAAPRDLLRLVLNDGLRMSAIGAAIGIALVLASGHALNTSDLHVQFTGPFPFLITLVLITACTLLASWFPAWRATMLPPMVAIRSDLHLNWSRVRFNYRLLTERFSEAFPHGVAPAAPGTQLLAAIAETSRRAESFSQAIELGLSTLSEQLRASSAYLFSRNDPDEPFCLTGQAKGCSPITLPAGSILVRRLVNYSSALPLSDEDLTVVRKWAAEFAPNHVAEFDSLIALGARLAAPVLSKSEVIGLLILGDPVEGASYSSQDRLALRSAAAQIALMLENSRLTDRIVEQERLRRELLMAAEVQKRLFPQNSPETAAVQLAGLCIPARGVGGDYYDFLELGNHQIGIALADVAGKGIAAALIMSIVQASLRSLAGSNGASLGDLAAKMNRLLHRSTGTSSYATFFYGQFDEQQRRLRYVNAGHNPPMLLRAVSSPDEANPIEELAAGGTIIGMFAQSKYEESSVDLKSGDVLIAFSDGVTEAHNPVDDEFGDDRLKDVLRRYAHLPIAEMSSQILNELKTWMADAPQFDDLTFILMKVA
jgi:predicted permease